MQIHNLKRLHKNKKARMIGRAGQRGKTSGRGTKGQNARSGHKKRPEIRDFIKRIPKMRGRGKNINTTIKGKSVIIKLGDLSIFKAGDIVSPQTLLLNKLISKNQITSNIKILSQGEIKTKLTIKGCAVSDSARKVIEEAGGSITK